MSRFVSEKDPNAPAAEDDEAWIAAQKVLDANKLSKQETGKQEGGKSLYETLQANKAAKQEAFEESTRLRNQFRSLDEDEADFLESVLASTRAKEAEAKKETVEQLEAFRLQQEVAEKSLAQRTSVEDMGETAQSEEWKTGSRKRKKQQLLSGIKKRATTSSVEGSGPSVDQKVAHNVSETFEPASTSDQTAPPDAIAKTKDSEPRSDTAATSASSSSKTNNGKPSLGLADYSSDDD